MSLLGQFLRVYYNHGTESIYLGPKVWNVLSEKTKEHTYSSPRFFQKNWLKKSMREPKRRGLI